MKRSQKLFLGILTLLVMVWGIASIYDISTKELIKDFCSAVMVSVTTLFVFDLYLDRRRLS